MKALVVEDVEGIRQIVTSLLESRGHVVTAFPDAESAWDAMQSKTFDLAVLDWGLPGMDGLDLCRKLRARPNGGLGVIIVLTGRAEPDDLDEVVSAGANDYVTKPFRLDALEVRVAFAERQSVLLTEQFKAARALDEAQAKYQALVEGVSVTTYIWRHVPGGELDYVSPQIEAITGWTPDEIVSQPGFWVSLIHPDDAEMVAQIDQQTTRTGERFCAEYRQRCKSGGYRWLRDEAEPIRDEHGNLLYWHGVVTDITERRQVVQALCESEQQQRMLSIAAQRQADHLRLLDSVRSALAGELDLATVFKIVVETTADVLGYPFVSLFMREGDRLYLQHVAGYRDTEAIYYSMTLDQGVIGSVARTGKPRLIQDVTIDPDYLITEGDVVYEICVPLLDGEHVVGAFNVETTAEQPLTEDDLRLLMGVAEHVNSAISRARLYLEARQSEQELRDVLDNIQEVVFQTDPDGRWTFLNTAWEAITGFTVEESLGRHAADFSLPEVRDEFQTVVHALSSGEVDRVRRDFRVITASGDIRWVDAHAAHEEGGSPPYDIFGTLIDITDRKRAETALIESQERYRHLAMHDALTSLPNRTLFMERLEQVIAECTEPNQAVSVLFLDLDGFKLVNDSFGHAAGDRLLAQVADRLRNCVAAGKTVARLSGDEFAVMVPDDASQTAANAIAHCILAGFKRPFLIDGQELGIAVSIGLASHVGPGGRAGHLLRNADTALYAAKSSGRGTCTRYQPQMSAAIMAKYQRETELRRAIERNELCIYYQPAFDLVTGRITSIEALVRWMHPELGMLAPAEFIALAESTGLIVQLGTRVLRTICEDWMRWRELSDVPLPKMSINVSARQLRDVSLVADLATMLAEFGIDPGSVELEISETTAMIDLTMTHRTLHELHELGVGIVIDDFGTGYGTLSSLRDLPVSAVKIDRGFTVGLGRDRSSNAIVRAMTALAQTLGLTVTAEGIETLSQLAHARAIGIDRGQGYYFTRPVPADAVQSMVIGASPMNTVLVSTG